MKRAVMALAVVVCCGTAIPASSAQTLGAQTVALEAVREVGVPLAIATPGPTPVDLGSSTPVDDAIPPVAEHIFELGTGRGFVSQRTDYASRSITVLWKGDVPAEVREYIATKPSGVAVTVSTGAKYSREEGNAARNRILNDAIAQEVGIISTSVNQDGSGLTLGVTNTSVSDDQTARLLKLAGLAPGDITINTGLQANDGYASRQNDTSP